MGLVEIVEWEDTSIEFKEEDHGKAGEFLEWLECHRKCGKEDFKEEGKNILYHFVNLYNFFEGNILGNGEKPPYERTLGRFLIERNVKTGWSPRRAVPETVMMLESLQLRNFQAIIPDIWHFYCTTPETSADGSLKILSEIPAIIYHQQGSSYSRN